VSSGPRQAFSSLPVPRGATSTSRLDGRVLVVDDMEAKRYTVVHSLRLAGMEVLEASNGKEALAALAREPDVVVLDVRLPDMSGFEVCQRLKEDPATAAIPVLYISALLRDEDLEARLFEDGADGYIPQPIEPKHLVAQTWALVRMRRAELARQREREEAQAERERLQRELEKTRARVLAELESSEARLRLALESAELGAWSFDMATGEHQWDTRAKELFGLPPEAPASLEVWRAATHPEDVEWVSAAVRRALAGEGGGAFEAEYRTVGLQDGGVLRWISARGRVLFGEDGQARKFSGTWLDITERKLSEQRAAELQATTAAFAHALTPQQVAHALVEHGLKSLDAYAGVVSLVVGEELHVLSHFGYPALTLQAHGHTPLGLHTPSTVAARTGQTVWLVAGEALERDWPEFAQIVRTSRSRSWLCAPLKDGERVVGVLGLSFSVARRFRAREQAHLESLCRLCAQALARARLFEEEQRAKEEARRRAELEQRFLGVVSHDLRNPLTAISLGARTLQRLERPTPEVLLRTAGRIATSADTMERMISDLLDFTRGRLGGGLPLERTMNDLVLLCHEVIDEFSVTHPSSDLRFEGDATCEGRWDGPRLRQVLSNLLSNALRHSRAETPVWVRARGLPDAVEVSVSNEGEPIPPELLPVLFEPFRRGMAKFRPSGSLGLGLYIVRQVVEGHGGRVEVATGEAGTTFTVRLPREEGASTSPARA
jgi:PAS domain S-box-containing protein